MRPLSHPRPLGLARKLERIIWPTALATKPYLSTSPEPSTGYFSLAHEDIPPIYRGAVVSDPAVAPAGRRHTPLVAVVSPMPEALLTDSPPSGVALYTSRLLETYDGDWDVVALGQTKSQPSASTARVTALPTWRPGWQGVWDVVTKLRRLRPHVIHVQHELRLYGGIMPTLGLILSLNWFRWRGTHIVITLHGVPHPSDIKSQGILPPLPGGGQLAKRLMVLYLWLILASSDAIVVLSAVFRQRLFEMFPSQATKVHVIPLGVDAKRAQVRGRRNRGARSRPHAIAFGFLTSYKSPELILDACEQGLLDDFLITLSVARNPRADSPQMKSRYQALCVRASRLPQMTWRQYLSDAELADLLCRADVLILPYTACVSSSAVAALAEGADVPIAYSKPLEELFGKTLASFELTAQSLADAVRAAVREDVVVRMPHALWSEVGAATFSLWQGTRLQV